MLNFTCEPNRVDVIAYDFVAEMAAIIIKHEIKTVPFNYYDKDFKDKLNALVEKTDFGFLFDKQDEIGVEPYGFVSDFFDSYLRVISDLKQKHTDVAINGILFVNDFGAYECVLAQRIESEIGTNTVSFFDQLQCVNCQRYVDADTAYEKIYDEEVFWTEDGDCLYPSAYSHNADNEFDVASFCFCSEECMQEANVE